MMINFRKRYEHMSIFAKLDTDKMIDAVRDCRVKVESIQKTLKRHAELHGVDIICPTFRNIEKEFLKRQKFYIECGAMLYKGKDPSRADFWNLMKDNILGYPMIKEAVITEKNVKTRASLQKTNGFDIVLDKVLINGTAVYERNDDMMYLVFLTHNIKANMLKE